MMKVLSKSRIPGLAAKISGSAVVVVDPSGLETDRSVIDERFFP